MMINITMCSYLEVIEPDYLHHQCPAKRGCGFRISRGTPALHNTCGNLSIPCHLEGITKVSKTGRAILYKLQWAYLTERNHMNTHILVEKPIPFAMLDDHAIASLNAHPKVAGQLLSSSPFQRSSFADARSVKSMHALKDRNPAQSQSLPALSAVPAFPPLGWCQSGNWRLRRFNCWRWGGRPC